MAAFLKSPQERSFSLGCRMAGVERFLHNPHFDLDEDCLPVGAAVLAETALSYLNQNQKNP